MDTEFTVRLRGAGAAGTWNLPVRTAPTTLGKAFAVAAFTAVYGKFVGAPRAPLTLTIAVSALQIDLDKTLEAQGVEDNDIVFVQFVGDTTPVRAVARRGETSARSGRASGAAESTGGEWRPHPHQAAPRPSRRERARGAKVINSPRPVLPPRVFTHSRRVLSRHRARIDWLAGSKRAPRRSRAAEHECTRCSSEDNSRKSE